MTVQTSGVLGKLRYVRKRSLAFADFLPILRWEFVTRIASQLLLRHVGLMGKTRVINARLFCCVNSRRATSTSRALLAKGCSRTVRTRAEAQQQQRRKDDYDEEG